MGAHGGSREDLEVEVGPRPGTFRMAGGNLGPPPQHPNKDSVVKGTHGVGAALGQPQGG